MPVKRKRPRRPKSRAPLTEHEFVAILKRSRRLRERTTESIICAICIREEIRRSRLEGFSIIEHDRLERSLLLADADKRRKSL